MRKKCSQCHVESDEKIFICKKGITRATCITCRNKSQRNKEKNQEKGKEYTKIWKKENPLYVKNTNEFYRSTTSLAKEDKALLLNIFKQKQNLFDKEGQKNNHYKVDNVLGKDCNTFNCGWKPLNIFNYNDRSWDKLSSTCSNCVDIRFMIRNIITSDINTKLKFYLKNENSITDTTIHPYLGCTIQHYKKHIESLFTEGMSWDKKGSFTVENKKKIGFHIDHIIPCCAFDLNNPKDLFLCFHWKNCQPLWGRDNMSKRDTYTLEQKQKYVDSMKDCMLSEYNEFATLIQKVQTKITTSIKQPLKTNTSYDDMFRKQQELYNNYIFDQALQDVQVMFFMYENPPDSDKIYTETPYFRMKNKQSRKVGEDNPRSKKVCKVSTRGILLNTYVSMSEAAKANFTYHSSISKCCSKTLQLFMSGGYYWCFQDKLSDLQHRIAQSMTTTENECPNA